MNEQKEEIRKPFIGIVDKSVGMTFFACIILYRTYGTGNWRAGSEVNVPQ